MIAQKRMLFLLQPGTNSRWIFEDIISGFRRAGHEALVLELGPLWQMYQGEGASTDRLKGHMTQLIADLCRSNRIDGVMGMWANSLMTFVNPIVNGAAVSVFDAIGVPQMLYWLDAPHWAHEGGIRATLGTPMLRGESMHHCINNAATAREMRDVFKMGHVHSISYGINEEVFSPRNATPEYDCVFGTGPGDPPPTPVALEELERKEPDILRIRRDLAERIGPQIDDISEHSTALRDVLRELLKLQLIERDTPMLNRLERLRESGTAMAAGVSLLLQDPRLYIATTDLVRSVEKFERAFTFAWMSRQFKCAMFGGGDLSAWGSRAIALGFVAHHDQAAAYSRGKIGLNAMRWQDDSGSNIKPLEISASGRLCVMSHRGGVDELLTPDQEIVLFRTPRDGALEIRRLLDDDNTRTKLANAARERTIREHTWTVRAGAMVQAMGLTDCSQATGARLA